jgi:hypothetical protein
MTDRDNGLSCRRVLDIRLGRLVEAHMALTDLQKGETLLLGGHCLVDDTERGWHASAMIRSEENRRRRLSCVEH